MFAQISRDWGICEFAPLADMGSGFLPTSHNRAQRQPREKFHSRVCRGSSMLQWTPQLWSDHLQCSPWKCLESSSLRKKREAPWLGLGRMTKSEVSKNMWSALAHTEHVGFTVGPFRMWQAAADRQTNTSTHPPDRLMGLTIPPSFGGMLDPLASAASQTEQDD